MLHEPKSKFSMKSSTRSVFLICLLAWFPCLLIAQSVSFTYDEYGNRTGLVT